MANRKTKKLGPPPATTPPTPLLPPNMADIDRVSHLSTSLRDAAVAGGADAVIVIVGMNSGTCRIAWSDGRPLITRGLAEFGMDAFRKACGA